LSYDFFKYIQKWSSKLVGLLITAVVALTIFFNVNPLESIQSKSFDTSSAIAQNQPEPSVLNVPDTLKLSGKTIKVATRIVEPFVIKNDNGNLGGFSIELLKAIAEKLGVKLDFTPPFNKRNEMIEAFRNKKSQFDIGIGNIVVTEKLRKEFEFSQPILNSGLHILARSQSPQDSVVRVLSAFMPKLFQLLGIIILLILIPAHIVWFVERNHKGGFLEHSSYFPGILKACWWSAATLATQAEEMPKGLWGRVIAVIWMFISVVFVAYYTGIVTSSLTLDKIQNNIKGFGDLRDKQVIVGRKRAKNYLSNQKPSIKFTEAENKDDDDTNGSREAFQQFINNNEFNAMVDDFHTLSYYLRQTDDTSGKFELVGNTVYKQNDAFLFPNGSKYIKAIDLALLSLQENGQYQDIYDRWFKK
jgi:polar amino acid transport system substrate-binding protein